MSIQAVLQQLLQSGQGLANELASAKGSNRPAQPDARSPLGGFAGGALTGGALGLLLGNKKFRKMGGKVAAYGGMAALGAVAYRAYQDWQAQSQQKTQPEAGLPSSPQAYAQLPSSDIELHSRNVLAAMIAAAKADGHIGAEEQALLDAEFRKFQGSAQDQQWISAQLAGPADPTAIARLAGTPGEGAEIYLASLLITDADSYMERAYLDELARQLGLAADLKARLEQTALDGNA